MQFALFNQLQMPRPWRQHEEVLMYKEAITEAVHAEAVGFDAYWQTGLDAWARNNSHLLSRHIKRLLPIAPLWVVSSTTR